MKRPVPTTAGSSTAGRVSGPGALAIVGIAAVLILISVSRLRSFALDENERDAATIVQLFARALDEGAPAGLTLEEFASARGLERQLSDADFLAGGTLLRRHGYLFAIRDVPDPLALFPPSPGTVLAADGASVREARGVIVAWPWAAPRTGQKVFAAVPGGPLWLHPNPLAQWSGEARRPALSTAEGWKRR